MQLPIKWAAWAVAATICYQVAVTCRDINQTWEAKINLQRVNFYSVSTSRDKWRELAPFRSEWDDVFDRESTASNSRHSLYKQLNIGGLLIQPTVSRIVNSETKSIDFDGISIGVSKTCVNNEPNGFGLKSTTIHDMQSGLADLEQRRDIVFTDFSLTNNDGEPRVIIRDLCVFYRTDGGHYEKD